MVNVRENRKNELTKNKEQIIIINQHNSNKNKRKEKTIEDKEEKKIR